MNIEQLKQQNAAIRSVCSEIAELLTKKNTSYGGSVFEPVRIFSKLTAEDGIKVRLDDKLSRLLHGQGEFNEDTEFDLIGYLVLMRVARRVSLQGQLTKLAEQFTDPQNQAG